MENILFVNACVRPESRTMQLAEYILDRLCGQVAEVNLEQEQIQPLNRERLEEMLFWQPDRMMQRSLGMPISLRMRIQLS